VRYGRKKVHVRYLSSPDEFLSKWVEVISGVPQGLVLGMVIRVFLSYTGNHGTGHGYKIKRLFIL